MLEYVSFCFPHVVEVSALSVCIYCFVVVLASCCLYVSLGSKVLVFLGLIDGSVVLFICCCMPSSTILILLVHVIQVKKAQFPYRPDWCGTSCGIDPGQIELKSQLASSRFL